MKKIMYSIVALVASFATPSSIMADETIDVQYLVIQQTDGTEDRFALKDYPEITFAGDILTVETTERRLELTLSDITHYGFVNEKEPIPTAIREAKNNDAETTSSFSYGKARFCGLKLGTAIVAYNINGQILTTVKTDQDGTAQIDLASLPKGVIVLRTPDKSIKIINK